MPLFNATVDLGTNPPLGESFAVEGDFGSDPITIRKGIIDYWGEETLLLCSVLLINRV